MRVIHGCKHHWLPFTKHKAKCSKCRRTMPWVDLVLSRDLLVAWLSKRSKELTRSAALRARAGHYTAAVEDNAMASAYAFAAIHVDRR